MTTEKQQFHSDALVYNQLQNILDFCQKKIKFDGQKSGSFAVIPRYVVQTEKYWARLSQAYELSKAARNSKLAASYFQKCFKCVLT